MSIKFLAALAGPIMLFANGMFVFWFAGRQDRRDETRPGE